MTEAMKAYKEKLLQAKDEAQKISDFIDNELSNIVETEKDYGYAGNAGHIKVKLEEINEFIYGG